MAMRKTVLHEHHRSLGAKMGPFGGYEMPIQYAGIIKEHLAARSEVAVFDTCHMGEFRFSGKSAEADLDRLVTRSVSKIPAGKCANAFLCNEQGGVIDDCIVYRIDDREFMMVVNAATRERDFQWITRNLSSSTSAEDESDVTAKIDIQGPGAPRLFQQLVDAPIDDFGFYRFRTFPFAGSRLFASRTGYTGEIGFELYCPVETGPQLWERCIALGARPAGLGARDTLRLEMCFPLYGHELSAERNAAESGLMRLISSDKSFIGSEVVLDEAKRRSLLVPLLLNGRRSAHPGDAIIDEQGKSLGVVTSGSFSPCLKKAIALGYVNTAVAQAGVAVGIDTSHGTLPATITTRPFYTEATARKSITQFLRHTTQGGLS